MKTGNIVETVRIGLKIQILLFLGCVLGVDCQRGEIMFVGGGLKKVNKLNAVENKNGKLFSH